MFKMGDFLEMDKEQVKEYLEDGNEIYCQGSHLFSMHYDDSYDGDECYRCTREPDYNQAIGGLWNYLSDFRKKIPWYEDIPEEGILCSITYSETGCTFFRILSRYDPIDSIAGARRAFSVVPLTAETLPQANKDLITWAIS